MSDLNLGTNPYNLATSAVAVLAYMDYGDGIESSWDSDKKEYTADLRAVPFYNCRERGFIVCDLTTRLCAIFCEHRNSDAIVVSLFRHDGINPPSFDDFSKTLPADADKYSMWQESFGYDEASKAADWIIEQFEAEYKVTP